MNKPKDLDVFDFDDFVKEHKNAVVDCWAPTCQPCLMLAPIIDELAEEHPEIAFGKVDFSNQRNMPIARKFGISGIPALLVFKDGDFVKKIVGFRSKGVLEQELGL